jgi:hypothetical protein
MRRTAYTWHRVHGKLESRVPELIAAATPQASPRFSALTTAHDVVRKWPKEEASRLCMLEIFDMAIWSHAKSSLSKIIPNLCLNIRDQLERHEGPTLDLKSSGHGVPGGRHLA